MTNNHYFLRTLCFYNGISAFAYGLIGPLYAIFVQSFDRSIIAISASWSAFLISTSITLYIFSKIGDRVKDKKIFMIIRCLIRAFVWISFIFTHDLAVLIILQVILGVGEAIGAPSFESLFAEHLDEGKHVREYAEWNLVVNIMNGLATIAGGILVNYYGFTVLFLSMAAISIICFLGLTFSPKLKLNVI